MIVDLLIVLVALSVITILITQIIKPALRGTPLFPYLRQESELKHKLVELEQVATEQKLVEAVEAKAHALLDGIEKSNHKEAQNGN